MHKPFNFARAAFFAQRRSRQRPSSIIFDLAQPLIDQQDCDDADHGDLTSVTGVVRGHLAPHLIA